MEAGIKILERDRPHVMYLSLTDYIQHKNKPGDFASNSFHSKLDEFFGAIFDLGAQVAITADHGMNDKSMEDGNPKVIFLQDHLDDKFGKDTTHVICPITDPYVVHHGALGGFVRVYCRKNNTPTPTEVIDFVKTLDGVEAVHDKFSACSEFQLPMDREADVVVIGDIGTVIGGAEKKHDLSALKNERLRSHGAIADSHVPLILSSPLNETYYQRTKKNLYNYDIFDLALNGPL